MALIVFQFCYILYLFFYRHVRTYCRLITLPSGEFSVTLSIVFCVFEFLSIIKLNNHNHWICCLSTIVLSFPFSISLEFHRMFLSSHFSSVGVCMLIIMTLRKELSHFSSWKLFMLSIPTLWNFSTIWQHHI